MCMSFRYVKVIYQKTKDPFMHLLETLILKAWFKQQCIQFISSMSLLANGFFLALRGIRFFCSSTTPAAVHSVMSTRDTASNSPSYIMSYCSTKLCSRHVWQWNPTFKAAFTAAAGIYTNVATSRRLTFMSKSNFSWFPASVLRQSEQGFLICSMPLPFYTSL